jgi:hypothetical protein
MNGALIFLVVYILVLGGLIGFLLGHHIDQREKSQPTKTEPPVLEPAMDLERLWRIEDLKISNEERCRRISRASYSARRH